MKVKTSARNNKKLKEILAEAKQFPDLKTVNGCVEAFLETGDNTYLIDGLVLLMGLEDVGMR